MGLKTETQNSSKLNEALKEVTDGVRARVNASDPDFLKEIGSWCSVTGNSLVESGSDGEGI